MLYTWNSLNKFACYCTVTDPSGYSCWWCWRLGQIGSSSASLRNSARCKPRPLRQEVKSSAMFSPLRKAIFNDNQIARCLKLVQHLCKVRSSQWKKMQDLSGNRNGTPEMACFRQDLNVLPHFPHHWRKRKGPNSQIPHMFHAFSRIPAINLTNFGQVYREVLLADILLCRCGQLTSVSQADHVILLLGQKEDMKRWDNI